MASLSEVQHAKEVLKGRIGQASWLRGIGIGGKSGSYCVKVNVDHLSPDVTASIPTVVEGVPVIVQAVGEIRPADE
jgi:hypothetical protein